MIRQSPITLQIPASADCLDVVRMTLYAVANKAGFSFEAIEDMKVAVMEACTNAILHAYSGSGEGQVEIIFQSKVDWLTVTVRDHGKSFYFSPAESQDAALHNTPLAEAAIGGLGIFMMQALMDEVEVRTGQGTEVVLSKRMSRSEETV